MGAKRLQHLCEGCETKEKNADTATHAQMFCGINCEGLSVMTAVVSSTVP